MTATSIGELCINTVRFLAVDAVEKANSGHPGTPGHVEYGVTPEVEATTGPLGLDARHVTDEVGKLLRRKS